MDKRCEYKGMKQRDWVKELEVKKKKKKETIEYDSRGWFKWYYSGTASSTNDVVYYNANTGTGNYYP
jgi:hypothetical protein